MSEKWVHIMAEKPVNIFTFLNQIYYKKYDCDYDPKAASIYMLALWLSHDSKLIEMVNSINESIFRLPPKAIYDYFFNKVPKGKRYIKWIKKDKEDIKKDKVIKELMQEKDISKREAMIYIKMI